MKNSLKQPHINKNTTLSFYKKLVSHENDRFRSFEHCFKHFQQVKNKGYKKEDKNMASLHLGFYLASWGMYRGSSFLLQHDYKIFYKIIDIIFTDKYAPLWEIDEELSITNIEKFENLIISIEDDLEKYFNDKRDSWKVYESNTTGTKKIEVTEKVSSILTTKILLGTIGCIPAYDRFFMSGIKHSEHDLIQRFGRKSVRQILLFQLNHKKELLDLKKEIKNITKVNYPLMKIIDSYFWKIGYDVDLNKLNKK